jgi:hypothetical protein
MADTPVPSHSDLHDTPATSTVTNTDPVAELESVESVAAHLFDRSTQRCYATDCLEETFRQCLLCRRPVCSDHRSKDDADYCAECYSPENTEVSIGPLIDKDGVTKEGGRLLKPMGEHNFFLTFPSLVVRMSREKLELCVQEMAQEVALATSALDKARIRHTIAQAELRERIDQEPKKLRMKLPSSPQDAVASQAAVQQKLNGAAPGAKLGTKSAGAVAAQLKSLGVSPEKLLAMLQAKLAQGGKK